MAQRKFTLLFGKEVGVLAGEWAQKLWKHTALSVVLTLSDIVWPPYGNSPKF